MADVRAFTGVRYDTEKSGPLEQLVSPPYDVIGDAQREELYAKSPYAIVRVDYTKPLPADSGDEKYARAASDYSEWLDRGILIREARPVIYYVEEDYIGEFGRNRTRCGFLAAVRVEDAESGFYRPHEKTLEGPKADRLKLTKATRANLSPVFSLYDDPENIIDDCLAGWKKENAGEPVYTVVEPDGVTVRMWTVDDDAVAGTIAKAMAPKSFFIADGHHRYETALQYRDEMREANPDCTSEEPWNFLLMYLVNLWSPGLTVLPAHRGAFDLVDFSAEQCIAKLAENFDLDVFDGSVDELIQKLFQQRGQGSFFGMAINGDDRLWFLTLKDDIDLDTVLSRRAPPLRPLDVTLLHSLIIEDVLGVDEQAQAAHTNLKYVKEASALLEMVKSGEVQAGFFLNPTPVDQVKAVAETGERMPQKSTYFYPKLVTGLLINPLD